MHHAKANPLIVLIGDGVSDLAGASQADVLFARRGLKLEQYCIKNGIPYTPYDSFTDIQRELEVLVVSNRFHSAAQTPAEAAAGRACQGHAIEHVAETLFSPYHSRIHFHHYGSFIPFINNLQLSSIFNLHFDLALWGQMLLQRDHY